MGWDAISNVKVIYPKTPRPYIADEKLRKVFEAAARRVKRKCRQVDGLLDFGSLDCSTCRIMIEKAIELGSINDCSTYSNWSAAKVKKIHKKANWDFPYHVDDAWAYWSAREFIKACAENDLKIKNIW